MRNSDRDAFKRSGYLSDLSIAVTFLWVAFISPVQSWAQCDMTVGSDAACSHSTLAAALLSAAFTSQAETICIAQNHTETGVDLDLVNWDNPTPTTGPGPITLAGGYRLCSSPSAAFRTELDGNATDPIISVTATPGRSSHVTLDRLKLEHGSDGVFAKGPVVVKIKHTVILDNLRGVSAWPGANVDIDSTSVIRENSGVANGAGIYCNNATLSLAGSVRDNESTSGGGGIFALAECDLTLNPGAWISFNESGRGGGLDIIQGSTVRGGGTGGGRVRISDNVSRSHGGGIHAGYLSDILLGNVEITFNRAADSGGGISVTLDGFVQIERFNFESCDSPPRCTVLSGNYLMAGTDGTAVHVSSGSQFRMMQGFIEENHGPGDAGLLMVADGENARITLDGVQIWDNQTEALFAARDGGAVTAGFISAAGNSYRVGGGSTWDVPAGGRSTNGGSIGIYSSILTDHKNFEAPTGTISAHCLMADTLNGLTPPYGLSVAGVDPLFIDPVSGNLRVEISSPANDYCDTSVYTPLDSDYDAEGRGYDIVGLPDQYGPYDLGADETISEILDFEIFSDGFELGDTSRWSVSVP